MAAGNSSVKELIDEITSQLEAATSILTSATASFERLTSQICTNETLRNNKGLTGPRDSGYRGTGDSTVMNPISVTSGLFENHQSIPEVRLRRQSVMSFSFDDLDVLPQFIRSRPKGTGRRDIGYAGSEDSTVTKPTSLTSGLFENLQEIPEIRSAKPEEHDRFNSVTSSSFNDISVCLRSKSKASSVTSGLFPQKFPKPEGDDPFNSVTSSSLNDIPVLPAAERSGSEDYSSYLGEPRLLKINKRRCASENDERIG